MSVIIKGMKYPESCAKCALWMYGDQGVMCPFKEHKYISDGDWQPPSDTERGKWCPLVELPENHGRLGDLDEVKTAFPCGESVRTECVRATIDSMPTIVEAEGDV